MIFRRTLAVLSCLVAGAAFAAPKAATNARAAAVPAAPATQPLRNLVSVEGVRENQLIGFGLVVGLHGTGDSTQVKSAGQSVSNLLKQFGLKLPEGTQSRSKNVATVMVSAVFPPGYRKG